MYIEVNHDLTSARASLIGFAVDSPAPLDPALSPTNDNDCPAAIIAVEFAGPRTTVDAIRRLLAKGALAVLCSRFGHRQYVHKCASPHSAYRLCTASLPGGWVHALLIHPHATLPGIQDLRGQAHCYLVEPEHSENDRFLTHFTSVLRELTLIPVLPHWAEPLWSLGVEHGLIAPVAKAEGMRAWKILPHSWDTIVRDAVRKHILKVEPRKEAAAPSRRYSYGKEDAAPFSPRLKPGVSGAAKER